MRALKARSTGEYETAIQGYRGLVVTVYPSGEKVFTYRWREGGRLHRVKIGAYPACSLATAVEKFAGYRSRRRNGASIAAEVRLREQQERAAPTIKQLADEYLTRHAKPSKRSWRNDERILEHDVLPAWGPLLAAAVTRRDVVALLDSVVDRGAPYQAGQILALVRRMYNFGIERGAVANNPASKIKPPAKPLAKDRVLSDKELRVFWINLDKTELRQPVREALRLQLLTGQRIGEVLRAEWSEIDLRARTWIIPASKAKNKQESLVPLSVDVANIFKAQPTRDGYVFPAAGDAGHIRTDTAANELRRALPELRVGGFTSHDLRRTLATRLAELGTARIVVDSILNHKDRTVTATYDRYGYLPEKRAALDAWAHRLAGIVGGSPRTSTVVPMRRKSAR
jgi:integrase